ncbi:hypothetical protein AGMMS50230_11900 [Spirochaetia bacterium]|nr:hypothetical protein AGMMS50230_11900 [Spirochaetia bacterium]
MKSVNLLKPSSLLAALLTWVLLCLLAVYIIRGHQDRVRLIRDNENERILNTLFTSVRDYDDFGSAVEANDLLRERITGLAVYAADNSLVYRWGKTPDRFDPALIATESPSRFNRYTIADRRSRSFKMIIHNDRSLPPGMPDRGDDISDEPGRRRNRSWPWFLSSFSGGNYLYVDISHTSYWNTMYFTSILYPLSAIVLLALMLAVRKLYLRNIEYRQRIEAQQNLVVLGTAASTLAHEIRNPLYSIKLQAGILKKIAAAAPGLSGGMEEIALIEEEVDRLSELTYKVNDYLRDPAGNPARINIAEIIEEVFLRLCGRSIPQCPAVIFMDSERARSVFENIIRNAVEAGGPAEELNVRIIKEGGRIAVVIEDRGRGILPEDMGRVFDPFYTSKSTGTGIGLALSRRFVEAAGGTIVLTNRTGGGLAVTVRLPCGDH